MAGAPFCRTGAPPDTHAKWIGSTNSLEVECPRLWGGACAPTEAARFIRLFAPDNGSRSDSVHRFGSALAALEGSGKVVSKKTQGVNVVICDAVVTSCRSRTV
jgi:hypothetical protein